MLGDTSCPCEGTGPCSPLAMAELCRGSGERQFPGWWHCPRKPLPSVSAGAGWPLTKPLGELLLARSGGHSFGEAHSSGADCGGHSQVPTCAVLPGRWGMTPVPLFKALMASVEEDTRGPHAVGHVVIDSPCVWWAPRTLAIRAFGPGVPHCSTQSLSVTFPELGNWWC